MPYSRGTADPEFLRPRRRANATPVLLIPGFMAGDRSLAAIRGWLRRRGSRTAAAGIRLNVDCGERAVGGVTDRLERLADRSGQRVVLIGQSRGGELGRVLAVRGDCCAAFREDLRAPAPGSVRAVAIYSKSDGIVSWQACLDPHARHVEVDSSHCGMSVNRAVYRVLAELLEDVEVEEQRWNG